MQPQARRLFSPTHLYLLGSAVLFGLLLATIFGVVGGQRVESDVPMRIEPLLNADISSDRRSLRVADGLAEARIVVQLPDATPTSTHDDEWWLWMPRTPVEDLWIQIDGWRSPSHSFFDPDGNESALTSGYYFALPQGVAGTITIRMHARSAGQSVLTPRLIRDDGRWRIIARTVALNAFVYATLFVLALVALQLYHASSEQAFAGLFMASVLGFVEMSAHNGHTYAIPGLRLLGFWRDPGIWAVELLYAAAMVQLVAYYVNDSRKRTWQLLAANAISMVLGICALLFLLADALLSPLVMEAMKTLLWIVSALFMLALGIDALRRKVTLIRTTVAIGAAAFIMLVVREALSRGLVSDMPLTLYGYQIMQVVLMVTIATALIMRIAEFREQNVHLKQAHQDVAQQLHRETAIAALSSRLRTQLRSVSPTEIENTVMRTLIEHLLPLVEADTISLIADGYHGRSLLLCEPRERQNQLWTDMRARKEELRTESGALRPQQRTHTDAAGEKYVEALIPMRLRAPAWGAMVMQRRNGRGFTHQELSMAEQMLQAAVQQSSDALATMQLRRSAEMDALTGTFNRRTIDLWLGQVFRQSYNDNGPVTVLFVDIDHFKAINDTYGHACGDQSLRDVARMLHARVGQDGLLGRYGGEEFVIVLPGRDAAQARELAENIRTAVQGHTVKCGEHVINMTVSIGVATRLPNESTPDAAVDRADKALYAAKNGGRNQVQLAPAIYA